MLAVILIWYHGGASAQSTNMHTNNHQSSFFGINYGGIDSKTLYSDSWQGMIEEDIQYRSQYVFGGLYARKVARSLYLDLELLHRQNNVQSQWPPYWDSFERLVEIRDKLPLKYIEYPILYNYVLNSRFVNPALIGGVYITYLLENSADLGNDLSHRYRNLQYGIIIGLAGYVQFYESYLILETRFSYGLKGNDNTEYWDEGTKNKSKDFSFMAGIAF